jgi:hypothetical protein
MGCCGINGGNNKEEADDEKRMRKQNKDIEKQIQKDKQVTLQCSAVQCSALHCTAL